VQLAKSLPIINYGGSGFSSSSSSSTTKGGGFLIPSFIKNYANNPTFTIFPPIN